MSSQAPWIKFWPAEFMMDTQHLSLAQKGVHVDLMCRAWKRLNTAIPNDDGWIKQRLRVDDEQFQRDVLPVLEEFWPVVGDDRVNEGVRNKFADMLARAERSRNAALTRHYGPNAHTLKNKGKS